MLFFTIPPRLCGGQAGVKKSCYPYLTPPTPFPCEGEGETTKLLRERY